MLGWTGGIVAIELGSVVDGVNEKYSVGTIVGGSNNEGMYDGVDVGSDMKFKKVRNTYVN